MLPTNYKKIPHGGYKTLESFKTTVIVCDFTADFTKIYIPNGSRTRDQMDQAARSGKQNIGEGSERAAASPKTEIQLVDVARASLEELKLDYEDVLRQSNLPIWSKDDPRSLEIRKLAYTTNRTYMTYKTYMRDRETAANCALCIINQACYLLDRQLQSLNQNLENQGLSMETHAQKLARWQAEALTREREDYKVIDELMEKRKQGPNKSGLI